MTRLVIGVGSNIIDSVIMAFGNHDVDRLMVRSKDVGPRPAGGSDEVATDTVDLASGMFAFLGRTEACHWD